MFVFVLSKFLGMIEDDVCECIFFVVEEFYYCKGYVVVGMDEFCFVVGVLLCWLYLFFFVKIDIVMVVFVCKYF